MSNQTGIGEKLKSYLKHPGSFIVMLLVMLGAIITFAVLLFLIAYILINGVPHIKPSLFAFEYTSENASLMPALINTIIMTLLSLLIAVPFGIFSAIFLVEYAGKGNKFVEVIRLTRDTFRNPFHRIWIVRNVVFCQYIRMGIFPAGRCVYTGDHDPSADHENNRRSVKSSSGFLQGGKLWTGSRKAAYRI